MMQHLPRTHKALGSILRTEKEHMSLQQKRRLGDGFAELERTLKMLPEGSENGGRNH